ncbi:hypothetical protein VTK56DRAFT_6475 [Thermocarpiscus australiensis]
MGRPPGTTGIPQLKTEDLIRIQTLYRDAKMGPTQIEKITGYTKYQIKHAIKKKTPTVGKRTGRPRRKAPAEEKSKEKKKEEDRQPEAEELQEIAAEALDSGCLEV